MFIPFLALSAFVSLAVADDSLLSPITLTKLSQTGLTLASGEANVLAISLAANNTIRYTFLTNDEFFVVVKTE